MIKYDNSTINDWNFGDDNIAKVYYGVTNLSRLPNGYTEVEYVENTGNSTVNLGIQLMKNANDTFEVVYDNEMTWTSGGGNLQTFLTCAKEISPYPGWYERFDNSGNVVIGGNLGTATLNTGRTLVSGDVYNVTISSSTNSNTTHDYPLNLFSSLDSTKTPFRFCKGKLYNMTVTYNGNLVRNLVPCTNSNNVAGLYDLVNDVFYSSESGYATLVAGNALPTSTVGNVVYQKITTGGTLPYDAEIEYLGSNGTQYINTDKYLTNTSNFEIGYEVDGELLEGQWGYVHQMDVNGAWVTVSDLYAFFGKWQYWVPVSGLTSSTENSVIFKSYSGVTVNGTFNSKTLSLTNTDNIATVPLHIFAAYDFRVKGLQFPIDITTKFKNFYLKIDDVLVLDLIPVRVGQVGYMYDKVSGQLYGNDGTGSFILGADKQ